MFLFIFFETLVSESKGSISDNNCTVWKSEYVITSCIRNNSVQD